MNPMSCRDRPLMSGAQVLQCGRLEVLAESMKQIRAESDVCIFSCVTNFLTSSEGSSTVSLRVEPIFADLLTKIEILSAERPNLRCLICPPMYRLQPIWYRESLSQILTKFSEVFSRRSSPAILMMSSFANPSLEDDGVHLTAYSGLEFVLHLFDSAKTLIENSALDVESKSSLSTEATRVLEDRLMAVEQDHRRLNMDFEKKTSVDAELADFNENCRNENWFVILGLAKLDAGLSRQEWQTRAKADVNGVLSILMGHEYPIVVVQNITSKAKDADCRYQVLMTSFSDSKTIRDTFGSFFTGGKNTCPDSLKHISIRNRITPGTQVRINILKLMAKRYQASNPNGAAVVIGYEPRPVIKITPPPDASDRRVQSFNYIDAIRNLPVNFSREELSDILERINPKLKGSLRSVFVVISDDMLPRNRSNRTGRNGQSDKSSKTNKGQAGRSSDRSDRKTQKRGPSTSPSGSSANVLVLLILDNKQLNQW